MIEVKGSEIEEGQMREFELNGKAVLVARVNNKVYAIEGRCTHLGCHLVEGTLKGSIVTCPCHGTQFDIVSGRIVSPLTRWPKIIGRIAGLVMRDAEVYDVKENAGKVSISELEIDE